MGGAAVRRTWRDATAHFERTVYRVTIKAKQKARPRPGFLLGLAN